MTIPSAPQYSDLYSQSNSNLVEAQAVSFRQTYDGSKSQVPALVTIPSSNVLLTETTSSPQHHYIQETTTTTAPLYTNPAPVALQQRRFHGKPVKAKNAHLPDAVLAFKEERKGRTVASAWMGGVIGLFTFGPAGAVIGAFSAYGIAKGVGKSRERRMIEQMGTLPARIATNATPHEGPSSNSYEVSSPAPLPRIV